LRPEGTPTGLKLARTSKIVGQAFNSALAEVGGSLPTWLILSSLKWGQWQSQHELARAVGVEGPTLTRHLDGLEEAGLVTRARTTADRRTIRVELTEKGNTAHERMLAAVIAFTKQLQAGLSKQELTQLDDLLSRLAANVERR